MPAQPLMFIIQRFEVSYFIGNDTVTNYRVTICVLAPVSEASIAAAVEMIVGERIQIVRYRNFGYDMLCV